MNFKLSPLNNFVSAFFILTFLFITCQNTTAQTTKHRIAVFSPIYIDSAFNGKIYKLFGNYLPKIMLPGLEFYNGAMMAIDSLNFDSTCNLLIDFYDYRSRNNSLNHIIEDSTNKLAASKVIIASFNNRSDIKILADYGKEKKIPIISATYPNDGSISDNSYLFLLNPTLRTHCKSVYKHLQKNSASSNIIYLTRKGGFEEMVTNYFNEFDSSATTALNLQAINLTDTFYSKELTSLLDTAKDNIIFCGSVNETFAYKILNTLAALKKYKISVIGMPTWDALKNLDRIEYKDLEVIYTSSYNYSKTDKLVQRFMNKYKAKYNAKPSDIAFKGYETMLRFGKTVGLYGANAMELFSDDMFKIINQLDIQPVYNKAISTQIDYYENHKIYFIKKVDGVVKSVN
jgi:hypothetical protein